MFKTAAVNSLESFKAASAIMSRVYQENPTYWPHGLSPYHFDGGLYLVREKQSSMPVGFVGWQERRELDPLVKQAASRFPGSRTVKVGYYSIGILPEFRGNGFAKEAVAKLIHIKSASVDRVKALIVTGNQPSIHLAQALHVPYSLKSAHLSPLAAFASGAVGGPMGAGMHGATEGNGMNEASRALLMSLLVGGAGAVGGAGLGMGMARMGTRNYLREAAPGIGKLVLHNPSPSLPVRRQVAGALTAGMGAGMGALGGAAGSVFGSGLGASQSAKQHNQNSSSSLSSIFSRMLQR